MCICLLTMLLAGSPAPPQASPGLPPTLLTRIRDIVRAGQAHMGSTDTSTRIRAVLVDLNGDGRSEAIVRIEGHDWCGTGGCRALILTPQGNGYRNVSTFSLTQLPIRLLPSRSNGWHDLSAFVSGGSIMDGYHARLRFNGRHYPSNPTAPPAMRMSGPEGTILLDQKTPSRALFPATR